MRLTFKDILRLHAQSITSESCTNPPDSWVSDDIDRFVGGVDIRCFAGEETQLKIAEPRFASGVNSRQSHLDFTWGFVKRLE